MTNLRTEWVDVSPALAEEWLKLNRCNRPLSITKVKEYAMDMRRGFWHPTLHHEPLTKLYTPDQEVFPVPCDLPEMCNSLDRLPDNSKAVR